MYNLRLPNCCACRTVVSATLADKVASLSGATGGPWDGAPTPPAKRRKRSHASSPTAAAAAAEDVDPSPLLAALRACGDRLHFAAALLQAPRRLLQAALSEALKISAELFGGDRVRCSGFRVSAVFVEQRTWRARRLLSRLPRARREWGMSTRGRGHHRGRVVGKLAIAASVAATEIAEICCREAGNCCKCFGN